MGNVTSDDKNSTINFTSPTVGATIPPYRDPQTPLEIQLETGFFVALSILAIILNFSLIRILTKRFTSSTPHILLCNIAIVDLLSPIVNTGFFVLGLRIHFIWRYNPEMCNFQGFFHTTLSTVFVNNVALIAISRHWARFKPATYHKLFANKTRARLVLVSLWTGSALVCLPPFTNWGAYRQYEGTCWLAWLPGEKENMAYNAIISCVPFATVLCACVLGCNAVSSTKATVSPNTELQQDNGANTERTPAATRGLVNTDIYNVAVTQLIVYIILWLPLTVMNSYYLKDWRTVDFRLIIAFLVLFFCRSVFNPLISFMVCSEITCTAKRQTGSDVEIIEL